MVYFFQYLFVCFFLFSSVDLIHLEYTFNIYWILLDMNINITQYNLCIKKQWRDTDFYTYKNVIINQYELIILDHNVHLMSKLTLIGKLN